jgi:Flp pilus assembly protein protease CpaA
MVIGFLVYFFLVALIIASLQDLKRREVDYWLNFLVFSGGFAFVIFYSIINWNILFLLNGLLSLGLCFALGTIFYYGRVFGGGDSYLLGAMFALFVSNSFILTLINLGYFILFLLFAGAIYGLIYGIFQFFIHFRETRRQVVKEIKNIYLKYLFFLGIVLLVLGFVNIFFLFLGAFVFISCLLYIFAKSIDKTAMIKIINFRQLREGDWLAKDIRLKGRTIKSSWEGLNKKQLDLLRKLRGKVSIKDGIPFVPAFLIAFLAYIFRDYLIRIILG